MWKNFFQKRTNTQLKIWAVVTAIIIPIVPIAKDLYNKVLFVLMFLIIVPISIGVLVKSAEELERRTKE